MFDCLEVPKHPVHLCKLQKGHHWRRNSAECEDSISAGLFQAGYESPKACAINEVYFADVYDESTVAIGRELFDAAFEVLDVVRVDAGLANIEDHKTFLL